MQTAGRQVTERREKRRHHAMGAHGLTIRADTPLPGLAAAPSCGPVIDLRWQAAATVAPTEPQGRRLLRHVMNGRLQSAAAFDGDRYVLRFASCCEFVVDADLCTVRGRMHPGVDPEIGEILAAGSLLAFVLTLRGALVLHASAVQTPSGALAIVGASGFGKSTTAAMLCSAGMPLVTDDVLHVELDGSAVLVHAGANELRLRSGAHDLAERIPAPVTMRTTVDGRLAVGPQAVVEECIPLARIAVPRPRRDLDQVAVRQASKSAALVLLLSVPRLLGWECADVLHRQFGALATLVDRVPVVEVDVPWGPPFSRRTVEQLADALGGTALTEVGEHAR